MRDNAKFTKRKGSSIRLDISTEVPALQTRSHCGCNGGFYCSYTIWVDVFNDAGTGNNVTHMCANIELMVHYRDEFGVQFGLFKHPPILENHERIYEPVPIDEKQLNAVENQ
ncbi:hypothetical protein PUN28_007125 [Cardiocondyla obscurior]|uniref:Uncharacterized protein n=1 Tax=Cardiocondyla obscurior TaxID=286306 RepID=A0AAW2G3K3_9HYME